MILSISSRHEASIPQTIITTNNQYKKFYTSINNINQIFTYITSIIYIDNYTMNDTKSLIGRFTESDRFIVIILYIEPIKNLELL